VCGGVQHDGQDQAVVFAVRLGCGDEDWFAGVGAGLMSGVRLTSVDVEFDELVEEVLGAAVAVCWPRPRGWRPPPCLLKQDAFHEDAKTGVSMQKHRKASVSICDTVLVLFPRGYFEGEPAPACAWPRTATAVAGRHHVADARHRQHEQAAAPQPLDLSPINI